MQSTPQSGAVDHGRYRDIEMDLIRVDLGKDQQPHRSHLFTVRLWQEEVGAGETEWWGKLQSMTSGEVHYFRDWSTLVHHLVAMLPDFEPDSQPGGTGESAEPDDLLKDP